MKPLRSSPVFSEISNFQSNLTLLQKDERGFLGLSALLKEKAGINLPLSEKNLSLMAGRLNGVLQRRKIDSYANYLKLLQQADAETFQEFISCLTTNTTEFFRESTHFEVLRKILPELLANKKSTPQELRIWCAASSTGQEPYTLLMTILETLGHPGEKALRMLATDIDLEVLARASEGVYSEEELKNVSAGQRSRFFSAIEKNNSFQFKEAQRRLIRFAQLNLIQAAYPFKHRFDVIFCRNVLIYFDRATTQGIIDRMAASLAVGGYLFIGHSEGGMMKSETLERVYHSVYKKVRA